MSTEVETQVSTAAITLPKDQFGHAGAPTEWWWHTGTLIAKDGRKFGFEINATGGSKDGLDYAFTQVEITDVSAQKNYQRVTVFPQRPSDWCQYDSAKPWQVKLDDKAHKSSVLMTAIDGNPLHMNVKAGFYATDSGSTQCSFDVNFLQDGPPLLVWGTGISKDVNPAGTSPITKNNYYYSLTRLNASGTIKIGTETIEVTGFTWMDHEYGAFPESFKWVFHNMQLNNGVQLSNYTLSGKVPTLNVPMPSKATLLLQDGTSVFVDSITTPLAPTFIFDGVEYFMEFKVEIDSGDLAANLHLKSLLDNQVFVDPPDPLHPDQSTNVYEGVASCEGVYKNTGQLGLMQVSGTAWIEQNLAKKTS